MMAVPLWSISGLVSLAKLAHSVFGTIRFSHCRIITTVSCGRRDANEELAYAHYSDMFMFTCQTENFVVPQKA